MNRPKQRGSTLVIMLAILAMITLLAATMSYTSRLEIQAAHNFADGLQADMARVTGLSSSLRALGALAAGVGTTQPWARPAALRTLPMGLLRSQDDDALLADRNVPRHKTEIYDPVQIFQNALADIRIEDESAKLNLNAVATMQTIRNPDNPSGNPPDSARWPDMSASGAPWVTASALSSKAPHKKWTDGAGWSGSPVMPPAGAQPIMKTPGDMNISLALTAILSNSGLEMEQADALARNIVSYQGPVSWAPGRSPAPQIHIQSANPGVAAPEGTQPYYPGAAGPYRKVEDLMAVPGMTPAVFEAIRPYVTVYSCAPDLIVPEQNTNAQTPGAGSTVDAFSAQKTMAAPQTGVPPIVFRAPETISPTGTNASPAPADGAAWRTATELKLPINTATAQEIENQLLRHFPQWTPLLCRQFAANIVDARDPDAIPTRMEDLDNEPVLGIEITPYMNEIWPNPSTGDGDGRGGQYVELYNPYDVALCVDGWTLRTDRGMARLSGIMDPNSYLIVTDNYKNKKSSATGSERTGRGSFYDNFGIVQNSRTRPLIEDTQLALGEFSGEVQLLDDKGNLIDYFPYSGGAADGVKRSFQRDDPRIRTSVLLSPTPFAQNACCNPPADLALVRDLFPLAADRDKAFESVADLLNIYCGRSHGTLSEDPTGAAYAGWAVPWSLPQIKSANSSEPDMRLLDYFCLELPVAPSMGADGSGNIVNAASIGASGSGNPQSPGGSGTPGGPRLPKGPGIPDGKNWPAPDSGSQPPANGSPTATDQIRAKEQLIYGRINVNTASYEVLAAADYVFTDGSSFAQRLAQRRDGLYRDLIQRLEAIQTPYEKLSDIFLDNAVFQGISDTERIEAARHLAGVLTTWSRSFKVSSRCANKGQTDSRPYTATDAVKAILCLTDAEPVIISWWTEHNGRSNEKNN